MPCSILFLLMFYLLHLSCLSPPSPSSTSPLWSPSLSSYQCPLSLIIKIPLSRLWNPLSFVMGLSSLHFLHCLFWYSVFALIPVVRWYRVRMIRRISWKIHSFFREFQILFMFWIRCFSTLMSFVSWVWSGQNLLQFAFTFWLFFIRLIWTSFTLVLSCIFWVLILLFSGFIFSYLSRLVIFCFFIQGVVFFLPKPFYDDLILWPFSQQDFSRFINFLLSTFQ